MLNRGCFPGIDDPARWVLPCVLREQAERRPDAPWFIGVDGETLSFGQAWADVERVAGLVAALGVTDGEPVVVTAGNYADLVRAWRGLLRLGVVAVLSNTELRGTFQVRQLRNCGTRRAVIDADRLPQFDAVATDVPALTQRLLKGGASPVAFSGKPAGTSTGAFDHWRQVLPWVGPLPRHHHNACVMYSSGTGGPGQGVLMPHAHGTPFGLGGFESVQLQADDPGYAVLPLHHVNGLLMQLGATLLPGTPAIVRRRIWPAPGWTISARTAPRSPVAQERGVGVPGIGSTKYRSSRIRP